MLDNNLKKIITEYYSIPNAPFSVKAKVEYLKHFLESEGLEVVDNPYYLLSSIGSTHAKRKIVFMSHIDHPGFVFKDSKSAFAFGTIYFDSLDITKLPLINVSTKEGKYLGQVKILKVFGRDYSQIEVESSFNIPKNSQGQWNVSTVKVVNNFIEGLSHDNDIDTSVLLSLIHEVKTLNLKDIQVHFLFTKHEEVIQQSSYYIARNNILNLNHNDLVINLEAMKVYPIVDDEKFSNLNPNNGLVLNISEVNCIYGLGEGGRNLAESLVNNVTDKLRVKLQHGLAGGSSDAWPFSEFQITSNIVTMNVPNEFKHNVNNEIVVPEKVKVQDVINLQKILREIITNFSPNLLRENIEDISSEVKERYPDVNNKEYIKGINERLYTRFSNVITRGYYYPESISDYIHDFIRTSLSYISYVFSMVLNKRGRTGQISYK